MGYAHEICSNLNVVSPKRQYPRVNRLPDFIFPISMLNLACSGANREVTCGRLIHFPQQECSFAVAFSTGSCHEAVSPWCLEKNACRSGVAEKFLGRVFGHVPYYRQWGTFNQVRAK